MPLPALLKDPIKNIGGRVGDKKVDLREPQPEDIENRLQVFVFVTIAGTQAVSRIEADPDRALVF